MGISTVRRALVAVAAVAATLGVAPVAQADVGRLVADCSPDDRLRFCQGKVATFDGVPLDANLTLPPKQGRAPYPLIVQLHGYGGSKIGPDSESLGPSARRLAKDGYAVLSYTARGFGESCGSPASRLAAPIACLDGYIRLADSRYEVRDTQHLAGLLVDAGLVEPRQIGVTGVSYGGGQSAMLATLRNRVRLADGSYRPWRSPGTAAVDEDTPGNGKRMRIAAAVPVIPWTDLAYSLAPNGSTVDYLRTSPTDDLAPVGVLKQSFVAGLFALGQASGYYAPPATDRDADLTTWFTRFNAGEPYSDPLVRDIAAELSGNHSAFYLDMDRRPAPVLFSNGFTDDLFPVDEALRYANKVRARHPDATVAQLHFDFGHQRGANKAADMRRLRAQTHRWFDRYVRRDADVDALEGVEAFTQTCPASAPSGGPFSARSWRAIHPGEVRLRERAARRIAAPPPDPKGTQVSLAVDPIAAGNNPCVETTDDDLAGAGTYRLPPADRRYTLLGSPTVIADLDISGARPSDTQIAARLWDVDPETGRQTLVARSLYRPRGDGRVVFQLHPNGYRFARGHVPKLELLGADPPYGRQSNPAFTIEVSRLDFRLPTADRPGRGEVRRPAKLFVPRGAKLAPGYTRRPPGAGRPGRGGQARDEGRRGRRVE